MHDEEAKVWVRKSVDHPMPEGIVLGAIFSVHKEGDTVVFMEQCDQYWTMDLSKQQAIKLLNEAIQFIESE